MSVMTQSPEQDAAEVLTMYWADSAGLIPLPVDPILIARKLGLEVYSASLDRDVSGVLVAKRGERPLIYLHSSDAVVRQRFTCAHEIGHYRRRSASGATEFGFVDRRDHLARTGVDPEERWANAFAAALLMPRPLLQSSPQRNPGALAPLFKVSEHAMRLRLSNLGLA